jgi:hypothetical protein
LRCPSWWQRRNARLHWVAALGQQRASDQPGMTRSHCELKLGLTESLNRSLRQTRVSSVATAPIWTLHCP